MILSNHILCFGKCDWYNVL